MVTGCRPPCLPRLHGAAIALLFSTSTAVAAHADVRPPVEVFITGMPRAAIPGRSFSGTFEFRATGAVKIDSLRLSGESWRVRRFRPALPRVLGPGARWRVAFTAVPADPRQPLQLDLRVSGVRFRKSFDLSPEAAIRAGGPGGVVSKPHQ